MAKISDLETNITLGRLATRAIKARVAAKKETVIFREEPFTCAIRWEDRKLCIQIANTGGSSDGGEAA